MKPIISPTNLTRPGTPPLQVRYCASFLCQLRGLTFRRRLGSNEGLLLVQKRDSRLESSIHMLAVWTDLAVFWIDGTLTVVDRVLARSWHPAYLSRFPARYVLELHPSQLETFQIGDRVSFNEA